MHTARQLDVGYFGIAVDGVASSRDVLFPHWNAHDRFGVVVDRPLGATGASMLIQLAITAFYDVKPARREVTIYPEIYLFHVGGRHGNHAYYDVYPPRKEVVVADDPAEVLEAINDRAITRLAVVDGPAEEVTHHWKEPAAALDRLASTFAYDPTGRVTRGDVAITATDRRALVNTSIILHPTVTYAEQQAARAQAGARVLPANEVVVSTDYVGDNIPAAVRHHVVEQRRAIVTADGVRETYRRIAPADALRMLHTRASVRQLTDSRPGG